MPRFVAFLKAALRDYAGIVIAGIAIGFLAREIWPPGNGSESLRTFSEPLKIVPANESENTFSEVSKRTADTVQDAVAEEASKN